MMLIKPVIPEVLYHSLKKVIAESGHFPLKAENSCFPDNYCVSVSQERMKTTVFTVLNTLSYYTWTKVSNITRERGMFICHKLSSVWSYISYQPMFCGRV